MTLDLPLTISLVSIAAAMFATMHRSKPRPVPVRVRAARASKLASRR